ncbi:unnamed protein product [Musa acuminata var. zebrina]
MQAGKNAMASVKETAGNVAASAKAGMDKTTATVQEKVEKMTAHTPTEKAMAEERKQEKVREAEINKQETMQQNAAAQQRTLAAHDGGHVAEPGVYPVGGAPGEVAGHPTGGHLISGAVRSRPIGRDTGTARPAAAHNPYVGSTKPAARGTGGRYA